MAQKNNRGGARKGAGRPRGSGLYQEATQVVRVPKTRVAALKAWLQGESFPWAAETWRPQMNAPLQPLPLFTERISAGKLLPAEAHIEQSLDLNQHLVTNPEATYFLKIQGDSMIGAGIFDKDIVLVDRSLKVCSGKIIIAAVNGELTVKRLQKRGKHWFLEAENSCYPPLAITEEMHFTIWGVVVHVLHRLE